MKTSKLYGSIIITYRCNAKCNMCGCWEDPTRSEDEISLDTIKKLPDMEFTNITGGEPFIRKDINEIVRELYKRTRRIVISTNGSFGDRILELCNEFPQVGIRISIEGLQETNDKIRGIKDGFNKGFGTLKKLCEMGHKDIGFGMTVQEMNADDLTPLYDIAEGMGMEFATAVIHNSFYFRKADNKIEDKHKVARAYEALINKMLKSKHPKNWFRAYYNYGLIHHVYDKKRLLPCNMGEDGFFVDPFGDVLPCNGMDVKQSMGNLNHQTWDEIWNSDKAKEVRQNVKNCSKNCWMVGSVAPEMKRKIWVPAAWVLKYKLKGNYRLEENKDFVEV